MNEQEFQVEVDRLFLKIEHWLEQYDEELDFESSESILTLILPDGSQMILSRQATLREVWLASPLGAFHFQFSNNAWRTRQSESLLVVLADVVKRKAGITLDVSLFRP